MGHNNQTMTYSHQDQEVRLVDWGHLLSLCLKVGFKKKRKRKTSNGFTSTEPSARDTFLIFQF